ncbi:MAG TPA: hypothetical protein VHO69_04265, partial [Phototrophicaceae bacterium]|nr:hypothetical protein [Phototrophicaceae bacterium]
EQLLKKDDLEGAIEQWVQVLNVQPDHEVALGNAVRYLSRLKYLEDAKELVWRALDSGTQHPSVYLTAADILRLEGKHGEAEDMRRRLARLPTVDDTTVVDTADYFARGGQAQEALDILLAAHENQPTSQKILIRLGDMYEEMEDEKLARKYYNLAAQHGVRTKEGKLADARLSTFAPALSDKERGSMLLAVREAVGFGLFFLLLAWQDAGLDLVLLGPPRWLGVGLSLFGGYLLVTATSSAQQQPLARLMGGSVPEADDDDEAEPTELPVLPIFVRGLFGLVGMGLLVLAFYLVANTAIGLVTNPNPPEVPMPTMAELFAGE